MPNFSRVSSFFISWISTIVFFLLLKFLSFRFFFVHLNYLCLFRVVFIYVDFLFVRKHFRTVRRAKCSRKRDSLIDFRSSLYVQGLGYLFLSPEPPACVIIRFMSLVCTGWSSEGPGPAIIRRRFGHEIPVRCSTLRVDIFSSLFFLPQIYYFVVKVY